MDRIYFAGPLFCAGERDFNIRVCAVLEEAGYRVFLPQRDGILAAESIPSEAEAVRTVFQKDTAALADSDILLFVTDGRVPDEGACVELGIAWASGKRCYAIRTDDRALESNLSLNPLVAGCFQKVFAARGTEELLALLRDYLSENAL